MTSQEEIEKLQRLVNSSGFPFQLRVAQEIRRVEHLAWSIIAEEHPWNDLTTGRDGFIDLIIGQNTNHDLHRMVIECKRTRDADWVFLLPNTRDRGTHVRCMWASTNPQNLHESTAVQSGYHDFYIIPESYISEFCVVRGTGEGQKPMLENLAGWLLSSTESFAREEISLWLAGNRTGRRYYVPVIVTNARLTVCNFDVASVSLEAGEIPEGDFEEVPFMRFRKSLTTIVSEDSSVQTISAANRDRPRTVLVVQSSHLTQLMNEWHLNLSSGNQLPRW
jgi:hypothetical protein